MSVQQCSGRTSAGSAPRDGRRWHAIIVMERVLDHLLLNLAIETERDTGIPVATPDADQRILLLQLLQRGIEPGLIGWVNRTNHALKRRPLELGNRGFREYLAQHVVNLQPGDAVDTHDVPGMCLTHNLDYTGTIPLDPGDAGFIRGLLPIGQRTALLLCWLRPQIF
ncbi:MAG TPA: hypothetical protein VGR16_10790 [Thermomicrobiales bacterium]|nr:hypothetical protein [Thermomicrobiales bacterium]